MTREEAFQKHVPKFTQQQAETFFQDHGGEVVSVWGRRGAPDYLVLSFATTTEKFGPVSLNPVAVASLRRILEHAGV
jgi:hypothetical protein